MNQSEHGISEADEIKVQKIPNKVYEAELYRLQGELGKLQTWVKATGCLLYTSDAADDCCRV